MRRATFVIVGIFLAAILRGGDPAAAHAEEVPLASSLPLESVMLVGGWGSAGPFIPVIGDGAAHLAYEFYLTNFGKKAVRLVALRVRGIGGAAFAAAIDGDALKSSFTPAAPPNRIKPYDPVLAPGASGVLYVFLNFSGRETPRRLDNTLVVEADGDPKNAQRIPIGELTITKSGAALIDQPFTGDRWFAANGPSNTSLHRRAIIVLDGKPRVPERYAIDWIKLGGDGNSYSGDQYKNSSYHAYNVPILAVAGGKIVSLKDGLPENVPHADKIAVAMNLANIAGNHIVEDIGGGLYVGYAHMIPGSITVKAGQQVYRGQVLGRLGNSGNSSEPHLHLQVCNAPSFLICEGVPMEFKRIGLTKYRIEKHGETPVKLTVEGTHEVSNEEPMEDELANFPAAGSPAK
ncbi:MAG TPA: M23 family metallopeptidase [Candidatus Binataceae bacterium]|nr:M23 family metallopeptidase [Candidatus Binataceae bacterium]